MAAPAAYAWNWNIFSHMNYKIAVFRKIMTKNLWVKA